MAVLIHGGIAHVVFRAPPDAGSIAAGAGGISVALGPAGRDPGSIETVPPPTAKETTEPVDERDELTPDDQTLEDAPPEDAPPDDAKKLQAVEAGETVAIEALQDVDSDAPSEVTAEEIETVAEPLKLVDNPMTDEVTSEGLETIEPDGSGATGIANADVSDLVLDKSTAANLDDVALEPPPSPVETLIGETRPDDQLLDQPESVVSDEVSTAAIAEAVDPDPIDVPMTPPQAATTLPEPTPPTAEATVAEVRNSESPETTDVSLEALDEPLLEPAQVAITEASDVTPEQVATRSPDPEPVVAPVLPSPRKPPPPEPTSPEPAAEEVNTESAELAGAGGEAGDQADGDLGSGERASGGGAAGARADYFAVLQAWLEQHKVYPRRAMSRRLEGVVALRFVMDRKGRVLDYRIEQSSGHRLLDRAVTALIERAQPLPTMPDDIKETSLTLVVPISFVLK